MKKLTIIWLIYMVALIIPTVALFYGIAELTGFITGDWPAITILIEIILGVLVYCGFVSKSKEAIKEETNRAIWIRSIIVIVTAGLLILLLIDKIDVGQLIEILVLLGLVLITAEYVVHTQIMAKEMQNQRYDTFRPVLDIRINNVRQIAIEPDANTYDPRIIFMYYIHNVGIGPALDGYILTPEPNRSDLGTLIAIHNYEATGDYSHGHIINIEKDKLPAMIIAYYKDVYGRCFESKREICLAIEENAVTFGTLKHRKLDREKDSDLIESIWSPSKEEVNQND